MGRGGIAAIPYFPFDVSQNDSVDLLEAEFGLKGFAVYVHLLQHIYGGKGYYVFWEKDVALLFARKYCVGVDVVSEIVQACIRRGIFDDDLFDSYRVLTSRDIQECYFYSVKRRTDVRIIEEILLVDPCEFLNSASIKKESVDSLTINVNRDEQRRKKETIEDFNSSCDDSAVGALSLSAFGEKGSVLESDEENIDPFDALDAGEVTKLQSVCDSILYKYWSRSAKKYDYRKAAEALNMFLIMTKQGSLRDVSRDLTDLLCEAVSIAADNSAAKWSYVFGIFRKWAKSGIKNYQELIDFQVRKKR